MAIEKLNQGDIGSASQLPFYDPANGADRRNSVSALAAVVATLLPPLGVSTVANLPAASLNIGNRRIVTDASATTFASIVAGGGANAVPVYSDGTNWRIG